MIDIMNTMDIMDTFLGNFKLYQHQSKKALLDKLKANIKVKFAGVSKQITGFLMFLTIKGAGR